jgi:hypothetical protein
LLQLQQMDIQIKQQEVQRKAQKDQMDMQLEQARLELERQKLAADVASKSDAQDHKDKQLAVMAANYADQTRLKESSQELDGVRTGMDAAHKSRALNKPQPAKAAPPKGEK